MAGTLKEGPELGGRPEDGSDSLGRVHDPRCWHGRVEGVGHYGPREVVLDESAHLVVCRWCLGAAGTLCGWPEAAMRLVEQVDEVLDGHADGRTHPPFGDLVIMVAWAQPQVVVSIHTQRSVTAPGGCHEAEADSNGEPAVRSESYNGHGSSLSQTQTSEMDWSPTYRYGKEMVDIT